MSLVRLSFLEKHRDVGLLILRVGVGLAFMLHGWPKISGGPEFWAKIGGAMGIVGISFAPTFWGFMAACSEFFGGLFLALGLFARPAAFFMAFTMLIATSMHITGGDGFNVFSHPLKMFFVFAGLIFSGPGRWSLDGLAGRSSKEEAKE